ncbi:MAG: hypothetical protein R6U84_09990 [Candidatus Cloacimonadales bacterium]
MAKQINPDKLTSSHFQDCKEILTSAESSTEELERVCIRLAHSSAKEAQDLLEEFSQSDRAKEVQWLECAVEEGNFSYMSPTNAQEERDLLAMKIYHKKFQEIFDLGIEKDKHQFWIDIYKIEMEAYQSLLGDTSDKEEQEDFEIQISVLHDLTIMEKSNYDDKNDRIKLLEKLREKILQQITTERYRNLDSTFFDSFHFDYEDF